MDESSDQTAEDDPTLTRLVDAGDHDELLREVDRRCAARDWDTLDLLAQQCRRAVDRGIQLWGISHHIEYRLALEAPGPWAGRVIVEGAGRFTPGPLPEVAASTHTWEELEPHVPDGPGAALTAHERVLRGENLVGLEFNGPDVLDIPLALQDWEPSYALATYEADRGDFPAPSEPRPGEQFELPREATPLSDVDGPAALADLVTPWSAASDGRVETVAVRGDASAAIGALGPRVARMAEVDLSGALAIMGWAGASGGAHGRRRGAATGRFGAWWALAALAGRLDDWPLDGEDLAGSVGALRWYRWDAGEPVTGWSFQLAAHDPARGISWAVSAADA